MQRVNPVIIPPSQWLDILDELTTAGNAWDGAKVHLFKNDFTPGPGMSLGDLTEADFTGYAASSAVTWHAPGYLPDGTAVVFGDAKVFQVGATPTILNTVYGYFLTDGAGTKLIWARRFDTPQILNAAGQMIDVLPSYPAYATV